MKRIERAPSKPEQVNRGMHAMSDASVSEPHGRDRSDPTVEMRIKARRRLIGAAVLLLAVVVIVPAVLDSTPRPLPDSIPIEIPAERTTFTPRLSLPPLPEPAPDAAGPEAKSNNEITAEKPVDAKAATAKSADSSKAAETTKAAEPKSAEAKTSETKGETKGRFVLQAAAPASETAAKDLAEKINAAGFKSYVSKVDAKDGARYRVRVGPYASRDEAEKARARLRAAGISANLVTL